MDNCAATREPNMGDVVERSRRCRVTATALLERAREIRTHICGSEPEAPSQVSDKRGPTGAMLYELLESSSDTEALLTDLGLVLDRVSARLGMPPPNTITSTGSTVPRLARG